MQRNAIIVIILSLALSSCATSPGDGQPDVADSVCRTGICPLLIIAMFAGIGVAVASHH